MPLFPPESRPAALPNAPVFFLRWLGLGAGFLLGGVVGMTLDWGWFWPGVAGAIAGGVAGQALGAALFWKRRTVSEDELPIMEEIIYGLEGKNLDKVAEQVRQALDVPLHEEENPLMGRYYTSLDMKAISIAAFTFDDSALYDEVSVESWSVALEANSPKQRYPKRWWVILRVHGTPDYHRMIDAKLRAAGIQYLRLS